MLQQECIRRIKEKLELLLEETKWIKHLSKNVCILLTAVLKSFQLFVYFFIF